MGINILDVIRDDKKYKQLWQADPREVICELLPAAIQPRYHDVCDDFARVPLTADARYGAAVTLAKSKLTALFKEAGWDDAERAAGQLVDGMEVKLRTDRGTELGESSLDVTDYNSGGMHPQRRL